MMCGSPAAGVCGVGGVIKEGRLAGYQGWRWELMRGGGEMGREGDTYVCGAGVSTRLAFAAVPAPAATATRFQAASAQLSRPGPAPTAPSPTR